MAANAEKTIEYAFPTKDSNVATGTSLAASTRHDFPWIGIIIPETTSRSFKSVILECYYRDAFTTVYNTSGWRLGITCGSNAASDVDYTPTAQANTGDHETNCVIRDVTDYFNSNFGTSASNSCQASFAMSTATAANIQNISAKLYITYEYETSASRTVKTVRIPIQSGSSPLTAAAIEIGTGGTTPAPANQIPALDTFLPETDKTYLSTWFEMFGNDGGAATTDFQAYYQVNDQTAASRCLLEQALSTGTFFHDIWLTKYTDGSGVITEPYPISASQASAFKAYSSTATRFDAFGGLLYVTYEYNTSSSIVMNSIILPLENITVVQGTSASNGHYTQTDFWITESNVTLAQSGVLIFFQADSGATLNFAAGTQTPRPYTATALVCSGGHSLIHRFDHNNGFSIAYGKNKLNLKIYSSAIVSVGGLGGLAYLNYNSGSSPNGEYSHNHTTVWYNTAQAVSGAVANENEILSSGQRTPNIISPYYFINGITYEINNRFGTAFNTTTLFSEKLVGEYNEDGWYYMGTSICWGGDAELSSHRQFIPITDAFNKDTYNIGKMNIETPRSYRISFASIAAFYWMKTYLTYHTNTFSVSGSFSNPAGVGEGVRVDAYRTYDNMWSGSTTSTVSGSYVITVLDNVYPYFASAQQDATHIGRSASALAV